MVILRGFHLQVFPVLSINLSWLDIDKRTLFEKVLENRKL